MKTHFDLIVTGGRVLASHPLHPYELVEESLDIGIVRGKIKELGRLNKKKAREVFDASGLHVLPGLIDTQVHFREPGGEHKEDIHSGSRQALLGGMTAFLEMPNTYPPTTTRRLLEDKLKRAGRRCWCDFGFFIGATPENLKTLPLLEKHPGCCGIKVFMGSSTGTLLLHEEKHLIHLLRTTKGPLAIHSEDHHRLQERKNKLSLHHVRQHPLWRDPLTALKSTQQIVGLARKYNRKVHILHVSTKEEMEFLAKHKDTASVEVTPQHLSLHSPDCYNRLGTLAQMNPPLRSRAHQKALWQGLSQGVVTMLGSDHAPHLLSEKQKKYPLSPSGMPGTQTMLPLMLNHIHKRRLSLKQLVYLLAIHPHRHYRIQKQGLIRKGFKAHLSFVDLKKSARIRGQWLKSKCGWSPFENRLIRGWPVGVLLHGRWAMREGQLQGEPGGQALSFSKSTALRSTVVCFMAALWAGLASLGGGGFSAEASPYKEAARYFQHRKRKQPHFVDAQVRGVPQVVPFKGFDFFLPLVFQVRYRREKWKGLKKRWPVLFVMGYEMRNKLNPGGRGEALVGLRYPKSHDFNTFYVDMLAGVSMALGKEFSFFRFAPQGQVGFTHILSPSHLRARFYIQWGLQARYDQKRGVYALFLGTGADFHL